MSKLIQTLSKLSKDFTVESAGKSLTPKTTPISKHTTTAHAFHLPIVLRHGDYHAIEANARLFSHVLGKKIVGSEASSPNEKNMHYYGLYHEKGHKPTEEHTMHLLQNYKGPTID